MQSKKEKMQLNYLADGLKYKRKKIVAQFIANFKIKTAKIQSCSHDNHNRRKKCSLY